MKSVYTVLYLFSVTVRQLFQSYYTLYKQKDVCMHTLQLAEVYPSLTAMKHNKENELTFKICLACY